MRRFRRRRRLVGGRRPWWLFLLLPAMLVGLFQMAGRLLDPLVGAVAEMQTRAAALEIINRVVAEEVAVGADSGDLVRYETDRDGNVTVLQVNTAGVNRLAARAVKAVEDALGQMESRPFSVPLGELLGSPFLAHTGPKVPIYFKPVGAVTARVRQQFEAAGFNQTRHQVLLEVEVHGQVVVPLVARRLEVRTQLPLAETVIAGKVPEQLWLGSQDLLLPAPLAPERLGLPGQSQGP